jgi:ABC-type multidrug transport system fused ATPase/permease subunit
VLKPYNNANTTGPHSGSTKYSLLMNTSWSISFVIPKEIKFNVDFQIVVLENGTVVEHGLHDFLLSKGGRYAELWSQQNNSDTNNASAV